MGVIRRFRADKLIRDKLPGIMRSKGIIVSERVMEKDEYIKRLKDKLFEEASEVSEAITPEEIREELSDLLEVIMCLSGAHDIPFIDIELARREKKKQKGSFEERIYNDYIEIDSDNKEIDYCLARPDKYPEIK